MTAICQCQYCDQQLEFDVEHAGTSIACPGCGMDTVLFVPGKLKESESPEPALEPAPDMESQVERMIKTAVVGIAAGVVVQFMDGAARGTDGNLWVVAAIRLSGLALIIWGCVNLARWKGYSGWYGFFAYAVLIGVVILACLPNRRKRIAAKAGFATWRPEKFTATPNREKFSSEELSRITSMVREDNQSACPYLFTFAPLALIVLIMAVGVSRQGAAIDAGQWQDVAPPGASFRALMPGAPTFTQQTKPTPSGNVEINKYTVKPRGPKELYLIVETRMPEAVAARLGGPQKMLDIGRADALAASKGEAQGQYPIAQGDVPGLEMVVFPATGAAVKWRIYATSNSLCEVGVYTSQARLPSADVAKFFESFKLAQEPAGP